MFGPGALAVLFAMQIGLMSALAGRVPAPTLALAASAACLAAALAWALRPAPAGSIGPSVRGLALTALSGTAALFLAPFLVLSHRYSDAPPGTELIFFACVGWGAIAATYGALRLVRSGRRRGAATAAIGTVAAVTGAAGILGNWERPSSFSPLVRFASEEAWMLVAGVIFIAGAAWLARAERQHGSRRVLPVAAAVALACALATALLAPGGLPAVLQSGEYANTIVLWSATWAASVLVVIGMLGEGRAIAAGASLMLAPALLSLLSEVEVLAGVSGPQPLVGAGVLGGVLLSAAGVARLARSGRADASRPMRTRVRWAAAALSIVALVGMFLPTITASVVANRPSGSFEFAWALPGWESLGGWAALCCALLLLAAAFDDAPWPALAGLGAPVAVWLLATTPYHVLTPWLSPDIQADFGTEYAAITFRATSWWPSIVAVGAAAGLVVVLSGRLVRRSPDVAVPEPARPEEP